MKIFFRILKSITVLGVFIVVFSFSAFAENVSLTESTSSAQSVTSSATNSQLNSEENNITSNISSSKISSSSVSSEENSSISKNSSNPASAVSSSNTSSALSSNVNTSKSSATSSKQNSYNNNISGGNIDDGIDNSGWGTGEEQNSVLQTPGVEADTSGKKEIFNLAKLFWILIWPTILLGVACVIALVYVNKKGFVEGASSKNNTKKRTVTYKPKNKN